MRRATGLGVVLAIAGCALTGPVADPPPAAHSSGGVANEIPLGRGATIQAQISADGERVRSIQVEPSVISLTPGESRGFQAFVRLVDGRVTEDVVWSSSDSSIAIVVPSTGYTTAVRPGRVTIVATSLGDPQFKGFAELGIRTPEAIASPAATPAPALVATPSPAASPAPRVLSRYEAPAFSFDYPSTWAKTKPTQPETGLIRTIARLVSPKMLVSVRAVGYIETEFDTYKDKLDGAKRLMIDAGGENITLVSTDRFHGRRSFRTLETVFDNGDRFLADLVLCEYISTNPVTHYEISAYMADDSDSVEQRTLFEEVLASWVWR